MASARPKFEEGEDVILQCTDMVHLNGEYTVYHVMELIDGSYVRHKDFPGRILKTKKLTDKFIYDIGLKNDEGIPILCDEHELRKKHKPSEFSFRDLMANLNSKIQEPVR